MDEIVTGREYIVKVTDDGECVTVGELVRCKDCRFSKPSDLLPDRFCICKLEDITKAQEDYCESGERRKNTPRRWR